MIYITLSRIVLYTCMVLVVLAPSISKLTEWQQIAVSIIDLCLLLLLHIYSINAGAFTQNQTIRHAVERLTEQADALIEKEKILKKKQQDFIIQTNTREELIVSREGYLLHLQEEIEEKEKKLASL